MGVVVLDRNQLKARLEGVAHAMEEIGKQAIEEWKKGTSTTQEFIEIFSNLIHTYKSLATLMDGYDGGSLERQVEEMIPHGIQILSQPAEMEPRFESFVKEAGSILGMGNVIAHRAHKGARLVSRSGHSLNPH